MTAAPERTAADGEAEDTMLIDKITPAAASAQVIFSGGTFLVLALTVSLDAAVVSLAVTAIAVPLTVHSLLVLRAKGINTSLLAPVRDRAALYQAGAAVTLQRLRPSRDRVGKET